MASPVVAGSQVDNSVGATTETDPPINLPGSIASGDLLLVFFTSTSTHSDPAAPSGWTHLVSARPAGDTRSGDRDQILYRVADGSEGATLTIDTGTSAVKWSSIALRITGHDSGIAPEITTGAVGTSANPNSGSITPGSSKDYLFLSLAAQEGENTKTGDPASYTAVANNTSGTDGAVGTNTRQAIASRALTTGSAEDPGSFTFSGSDDWAAWTVLIHPTGGGGGGGSTDPGWAGGGVW